MCERFQRKRMFPPRNNEFARNVHIIQIPQNNQVFLYIHYLEKEIFFFVETFTTFKDNQIYLWAKSQIEISLFDFSLQISFHKRKLSKRVIILKGRYIDPYPFELLLFSSGPTCGQNTTSKAFNNFEYFPHEHILNQMENYVDNSSKKLWILCSLFLTFDSQRPKKSCFWR
jgi:hypothetical protein